MAFTVQKIPIGTLIGYFVGYLIIHIGIGLYRKHLTEEYNKDKSSDTLRSLKFCNIAFKIFPAAYVIFLLLVLH